MASFIKKRTEKWTKTVQGNIINILENQAVPRLKELILEDYDFDLNDVANPKSLLAPDRYMDEFSKRLDGFDYIDKKFRGIKFVTPDMENFDFRAGLEPIETILEGLIGRYVEVKHNDYSRATGRQTYKGMREEVYLIKYTAEVRTWEKKLDRKFEEYAFSNTPPLDIFGRGNQFIEENLGKWVDDAIKKSQKEFKL